MRYFKIIGGRLVIALLAAVLACGSVPAHVAWGVEASQDFVSYDEESGRAADSADGVADDESDAKDDAAEVEDSANKQSLTSALSGKAVERSSSQPASAVPLAADESSEPATVAEEEPYSIEATFDGTKLGEGKNTLTDVWTTGSKIVNVKLTRNKSVAVDSSKQYVLCMSVPDTLYFNGVSDASKINGVDQTAMVQNAVPTFNATTNKTVTYNLSPYSGEMRLLLNTTVDNVTIADLGISFNPELLGYMTAGNTTIKDALSIRVVAVDASLELDKFASENATSLVSRKVDSLPIKNGEVVATDRGLRMRLSTDGFNQQSATSGILNVGRGGNIAYVLEAGQKSTQVYKKLTVVLSCPYIWADKDGDGTAEKHYLSFDENDPVLTTNRLSANGSGFDMASKAVYDSEAHTITYTFKNIYLAAWQMIAVTPQFSWPSELGDSVTIPDKGYQIYFEDGTAGRKAWTITEEQTYCGTDTTLLPTSHNGSGSATFVNDGVNLTLKSSAEDVAANGGDPKTSTLGKRVVYKDVTRANGTAGGLGFFDFHNDGVSAAPASRVTFEFNTDGGTGATYYVNRVNIPLDGNTGGTDIKYTLVNGAGNEISGSKHFSNTSSFDLYARDLVSGGGSGTGYYFKKISYTTANFRAGASYHSEVSHGRRNFVVDKCLYFGYVEGDVGDTACAKMTIESLDGSALNTAGDKELESIETTWVGDEDSVYLEVLNNSSTKGLCFGSSYSQSITAGDTSTLSFRPNITNAENQSVSSSGLTDSYTGILNGYHTVRNPIMYVCLPKDVTINGTEQASIVSSGKTAQATSVKQLAECTYEGVDAAWWEVRFEGASFSMSSVRIDLKLSTSLFMSSVNWSFEKAVAFRADGQALKGSSTTTGCSPLINTTERFKQLAGNNSMLQALETALESDPYADGKLGLFYYTYGVPTTLNIARAEAKLDVDTELLMGSNASQSLKVTDPDADIDYAVSVSSADGGHADAFEYYVPIPKTTSAIDTSSFVSQKDFDLQLREAVKITDLSSSNAASPFEVYYTTKSGLDSASVRTLKSNVGDASLGWMSEDEGFTDFANATAVLIMTKPSSQIAKGAKYRFDLSLGYDNTDNEFASKAGYAVQWRSFGHYVYTRNGSSTENTYPSQVNSVRLGYNADLTNTPIVAELKTDADDNLAGFGRTFSLSFAKAQTLTVKNVVVSGGTTLVTDDPSSFTGANANSMFRMALGVNGIGTSTIENGYSGGTFSISAGTAVNVSGGVRFSKALTDATTERYVDVLIGNDDIDITVRIKLKRTVKAASATKSGTVEGEQFQAANVSSGAKAIASNGAFTALYVVDGFVPGNFSGQKLVWKKDGEETQLPPDATVTMLVLNDKDAVSSRWVWRSSGESSIDLKQFTRMAGSGSFSYDTTSTSATTLKYQFVVSLPAERKATGSYALDFEATPVSGATAVSVGLPVTLAAPSSFTLVADGGNVTYGYTKSDGDDVRTTGKQLALVLTPTAGTALPADAAIKYDGKVYARNASGSFIVPLGTVGAGKAALSLVSSMAGASGGDYAFDTKLMLYSGAEGSKGSPMAGTQVDSTSVTLGIAESSCPSIKVTGTRVAHKSEWSGGVDFSFDVNGIPEGGSVTVSAFNGLKLTTPATNLMSSVGGVFDLNGGTGTYKGGTSTGKLILNSAVDAGTYRLVFEVKDASGTVLATATHYVVVRN